MKIIYTALSFSLLTLAANAQDKKEYPKPEQMRPAMTEFWTPQPKIISPADFDNHSIPAPSDAIVLFDGSTASEWIHNDGTPIKWGVADNILTVKPGSGEIRSVREFDDFQLHIEWSAPSKVQGTSQGRGNSGVFLQGLYEIQILDNYENETYANGQAGSVYKQTAPLVNVMQKPGKWNVYDIIYKAPTFKNGKMATRPTVTVIHNGVVVQNNTTILGTTEYIGLPREVVHGKGPLRLQDHGNETRFRNIWIREL